jgi:predicted transcriptional regulator
MDDLLLALAHPARRQIARELRQQPKQKHGELLAKLGMTKQNRGQLTKLLAPLENAGLVERTEGEYQVVDGLAMGRLLVAAADLDVSAHKILARRAQVSVVEAESLARELASELDDEAIS